jgi:hypothetical protein
MSQSNEGCIAHVMGQFITNVWKFSVEFLILLYALKQVIYEICIINPIVWCVP